MLVASVVNVSETWEWFEAAWRRELRQETVRVNMNFSLLDSWSQIQIKASVESFFDQIFIDFNLSK